MLRNRRSVTLLCFAIALAWGGCGDDDGAAPDGGADGAFADASGLPPVDFDLDLPADATARPVSQALLGHYDLSGALFDYDQQPGLVGGMAEVGFAEWRVSVGRWEAATWLLPTLTDSTPCSFPLPQAFAPAGWTDLNLIEARDWFTDDGSPVAPADLADDARYQLDYVHQVIDVVEAFGAAPFMSLDHMPRALAVNRTPNRSVGSTPAACEWTFTNQVSNVPPADPQVYATAVVGLVQRVVEGAPGYPARAVQYWEVGNEPEFCQFWDAYPSNGIDCLDDHTGDRLGVFFDTAVPTLVALSDYRSASAHPAASELRFGLGSFATGDVAATALTQLDVAPMDVPLDFVSFHAYDVDARAILAVVAQVADARAATTRYQAVELVLAEWGPTLGLAIDPDTMDQPLLMSTVLSLGAGMGLDRAHHTIFWDFYPAGAIVWGLLDHGGQPRPLHHAYRLLARLLPDGAERLELPAAPGGYLAAGGPAPADLSSVLATRDPGGTVRVLAINHEDTTRTFRLRQAGVAAVPTAVDIFADPAAGITSGSAAGPDVELPPRSLTLVVY